MANSLFLREKTIEADKAATIITIPPIVGVPLFAWWLLGPSSLMV